MTTVETTFIVIIILLGLVMIVSIWWAVFTRKIKKLENNISERLQVTDIVLASKKEFLRKLAEQLNNKTLKEVPKALKNDPKFLWTSLERKIYFQCLDEWEKEILKEVKKSNKSKNKEIVEALEGLDYINERLFNNIFIYNNQVLVYNYKLSTKQGIFFLKRTKFHNRETIDVNLDSEQVLKHLK